MRKTQLELPIPLGDDWLVRLPRRAAAAELIENEQRFLPRIAPRLPVAVPEPRRIGVASERFPWSFSILRWIPGESADRAEPDAREATPFAEALRALHRKADPDAPTNAVRGVP